MPRFLAGWLFRVVLTLVLAGAMPMSVQARESRYGAIVVDADSGNVLYSANPDRHSYPASLTKVMTLFLLFDALDQGKLSMNSRLPVSAHATKQAPSKLALRVGDTIEVEDAVLALVTKSANDVAVVIAEAVGGSEAGFAQMMTRKAQQLGMNATTYRNASGLPNPGQMSTPRDQATLARALIRVHGRYYHYFSTRQFVWKGQPITTHNRLMLRYQGADGIKTGYINASGFNLIASAKRDNRRLIGVVFGGDTATWRDNNMAQILDKGFARVAAGNDQRSAQAEAEDNADLDRLVAAAAPVKAKAAQVEKPKPVALAKVEKVPPAKAKAKPAPDREEGDAGSDAWGIQVGAFGDYKASHRAASNAARNLGGLVSKASIAVAKLKTGSKVVFRSRLVGFTEDQARAACKRLSRAKQSCTVVQPTA